MLVSLDEPVRYIDRHSTAYGLGAANYDIDTANHRLCIVCRSIFNGGDLRLARYLRGLTNPPVYIHYQYTHHQTMTALRTTMNAGCPMCTVVLHKFERKNNVNLQPTENFDLRWNFKRVEASSGS